MLNQLSWQGISGLLIDTNLLILFIVGSVNRNRIQEFKRTSKYSKDDFDLLLRIVELFEKRSKLLYTVTQVIAEVSNLTDLKGPERLLARYLLRSTLESFREPEISSIKASQGSQYERLGIADSAIAVTAREYNCAVLTDDFDLYHALITNKIEAINFTHLRASKWDL